MPDPQKTSIPPSLSVVRWTIFVAFIAACLLQVWRFPFALTDDTLSGWLPLEIESFRKLFSGSNPFISDSVFGGGYPMLSDATSTCSLSPWAWAFSWLAITPCYWLLADLVNTLDLVITAAAFAYGAVVLRTRFGLPLSNKLIVAISLSYAFTPFAMLVGPSWVCFVHTQAVYPIVLIGLLEKSVKRGVVMIAAALAYGFYGGHPHPLAVLVLVMGATTIVIAWRSYSSRPLINFACGGLIALLMALPAIIPMQKGFSSTERSQGVTVEAATALNLPSKNLISSWLLGAASSPIVPGISLHFASQRYTAAIAFALVNIPLTVALIRKRRWSAAELLLIVGIIAVSVSIVRPQWLGDLFSKLPLLKSLRWPFRELSVLTFFTHLLAILVCKWANDRVTRISWMLGSGCFAIVFFDRPPSFNDFDADRELLRSGRVVDYWNDLRIWHGSRPLIVPVGPPILVDTQVSQLIPWTLLGAYNHPAFFQTTSAGGYNATTVSGAHFPAGQVPYHWSGFFHRPQAEAIQKLRADALVMELLDIKLYTDGRPPVVVFSATSHGRTRAFVFQHESNLLTEITEGGAARGTGN